MGVKSKWEKVQSGLLFTPVSITTLIGTEDARFILNGISPIAKGNLKWRAALLVTGTVNSNHNLRASDDIFVRSSFYLVFIFLLSRCEPVLYNKLHFLL